MAFIEKKDPVLLNIKLTTCGRQLLSTGTLGFNYFALGDSEIDYGFINNVMATPNSGDYSAFDSTILRPADNNPKIISFIPRNLTGDPYNVIPNIPSSWYPVTNTVEPIGFFTSGGTSFIYDSNHVKQPDAMVYMNGISGGKTLRLFKAPTYGASGEEPSVGDLLLVKWTFTASTTGYTVTSTKPTPYLFYQIVTVSGGTSLAANNLVITVDRDLPNFSSYSATGKAGAMVYYSGNTAFLDTTTVSLSSTEYLNESVISFLENSQCPTVVFPFWNMSIIFTEEIAGVLSGTTDRKYTQFNSRTFGGFVSYIQSQAPFYKKLGVIHYTNSSPANVYAEGFYQNTARLIVPTIMWHKSKTKTLGATFFAASGNGYTLTTLGIHYYNLVDDSDNVVGKLFDELKMFVIEDQELLFAMSYKSNRSWTLSDYNVTVGGGCVAPPPPAPVAVLPTVITTPISSIFETTAAGGGEVTSDGGAQVTSRGVVWDTVQNPTLPTDPHTTDGSGTGGFSSSLTPLVANTTYYVRAYAINSVGLVYGVQVTFVTATIPIPPVITGATVTTTVISAIGLNSATGGGNVTSDGGAPVTARGVVWNTSPSPTIANSKSLNGSGNGIFTSSLIGLAASTVYYVRAYATNSWGTNYGAEVTFTTTTPPPVPVLPIVTVAAITSILQTTATGGGNVTSDGNATVTARGIVWSTSQNPTTANNKTINGGGIGAFTSLMTSLVASTTYYVRAYATNSVGTAYSQQTSFTTAAPPPPPTTYIVAQLNQQSFGGNASNGFITISPALTAGQYIGVQFNTNQETNGFLSQCSCIVFYCCHNGGFYNAICTICSTPVSYQPFHFGANITNIGSLDRICWCYYTNGSSPSCSEMTMHANNSYSSPNVSVSVGAQYCNCVCN